MNASGLEMPFAGCSYGHNHGDIRELAQYQVTSDTFLARWDTVLADGRQMTMMDVFTGHDAEKLQQWIAAKRAVVRFAFAAMESPQEQIHD